MPPSGAAVEALCGCPLRLPLTGSGSRSRGKVRLLAALGDSGAAVLRLQLPAATSLSSAAFGMPVSSGAEAQAGGGFEAFG